MKPDDYEERPHFGEILWSDYFQSRIVVVAYRDDDNWWFHIEKGSGQIAEKAQTPFSKMQKVVSR